MALPTGPFSYNYTLPRIGEGVNQTTIRFQPQGWYGSGASAKANNYIRFDFRSKGFWDPLATYINIDITIESTVANQILQLDNSAQSLISQYIARHNGTELIRIQEYDEMASFLYDVHLDENQRETRISEGLGCKRAKHQSLKSTPGRAVTDSTLGHWPSNWNSVFPIVGSHSRNVEVPSGKLRKPWCGSQEFIGNSYMSSGQNDSGWAFLSYLDMYNLEDTMGCEVFTLGQPNKSSNTYYTSIGPFFVNTAHYGLGRINTDSCVGSREMYISNYLPKPVIKGGIPCYERSSTLSFQIPLLCPIFGSLAEHGKLLPMELFDGLEFEFLLNPYAFFVGGGGFPKGVSSTYNTSGIYNDGTWTRDAYHSGSGAFGFDYSKLQRNSWYITKFEIVTEITTPDLSSSSSILSSAVSNFSLDFKTWYLGPRNKYSGGDNLSTDIQINNGFESLSMLLFYFQPADYETYPFCRKHKRISNNLTYMQLRIGNIYLPSQPITGHAGNIRPDKTSSTTKGNYTEFFVQTMKAFGKWLKSDSCGIINPTNYTLNTIGYDPTQTSGTLVTNGDAPHTLLDMALWFENQIIPRSLFAFDLTRFDSENAKSGWDTTRVRPFNLTLKNDNSPVTVYQTGTTIEGSDLLVPGSSNTTVTVTDIAFPRPYYLYIWMYYDARLSFTPGSGWVSEGRV